MEPYCLAIFVNGLDGVPDELDLGELKSFVLAQSGFKIGIKPSHQLRGGDVCDSPE
jgi:hypothetical protein